ncbi:MAG TPA: hypothetical protein VG265_14165 [Gaiellaceae bacterium]|nr:hypothetical protein [Gaiellaceae bacterium]
MSACKCGHPRDMHVGVKHQGRCLVTVQFAVGGRRSERCSCSRFSPKVT